MVGRKSGTRDEAIAGASDEEGPSAGGRAAVIPEIGGKQPKVLLAAARKLGRVQVQSRSGERFVIQSTPAGNADSSNREDFRARLRHLHRQMRASGSDGFTAAGWKTFCKAIAGE